MIVLRAYGWALRLIWPAPAVPFVHTITPGEQVHKVRRNGTCSHAPCNGVA